MGSLVPPTPPGAVLGLLVYGELWTQVSPPQDGVY